ncbi:MAG: glycosyltransferase [Candidatus Aminicenantes bacterium]|nr:glycosyltransferase [Candidatus Aminicenantes bacterium]
MKTVLFLSHTAELYGAELMLLQTLSVIDRSRFLPVLVIPRAGPLEAQAKELGLETRIIPSKWWLTGKTGLWKQPFAHLWNLRGVFRLARFLGERRIHLVFSNSAASFSGALAAKIKGIPHIWAIHEVLGGKKPILRFIFGQRSLAKLILRLSCRVVVNSHASEKAFCGSPKVRLVYNGIEVLPLDDSNRRSVRRALGFSEEDVVLGMVGRISAAKGQRQLITALGMVREDYPRVKVLLVGESKQKNYFFGLQKLIERRKLEGRVVFTGYRKDVIPLLKAVDCLFVASKVESFGRTIIEALSVRTPVVAVKSGGIPEIISHGENGYLLESREPEELKKAICTFIREREAFDRAANRGEAMVVERFSLKNQKKLLESVLEECFD